MRTRVLRAFGPALAALGAAALLVSGTARAEGPIARRDPCAGYAYPAGGRRGTTFRVTVGGQNLAGADTVHVSGRGVSARVIRYEGGDRRLNGEERRELQRRIAARRRALRGPSAIPEAGPRRGRAEAPSTGVELPKHPLLDVLDELDLEELDRLEARFLVVDPRRQPNAQIAETVLVEVTVDADAPAGERDFRLGTRGGLTNPVRFRVGTLPEVREVEWIADGAPNLPVLAPPVLVNGQVLPGDVDRHRLRLRAGQRLVIEVRARALVPFLADAVPGWFQAVASLRDDRGAEVAFDDDYRFDPDPVLLFTVPRDGEYVLEIRDALYRGREDFVYRVSVGEVPFVTGMFPLGARIGTVAAAVVAGWNLPTGAIPLDTAPGGEATRRVAAGRGDAPGDPLAYRVDALPEAVEAEPNDAPGTAGRIDPPCVVNGRIGRPGDADVFGFRGRAGDEIVAEVHARRLGSPMDSLLRLTDDAGNVLAWNDDADGGDEADLRTHRSDSLLRLRLPLPGLYFVQVRDAQGHGGEEYAYRLRVGPPQPDFELHATPSGLTVPAGRTVPFEVHATRRGGFDGEIAVALAGDAGGFLLGGARIPAGRSRIRMTLTAPAGGAAAPVALRLEGRARIGRGTVVRPVEPADERMQAFIYRHLVPAREWLVEVRGSGRDPPSLDLPDGARVRIPSGGRATVRFRFTGWPRMRGMRLVPMDPPAGVAVERVGIVTGGVEVVLSADRRADRDRTADNLVLEAVADVEVPARGGRGAATTRTVSLGFLPAIPVEIR